MVGVDRKWLLAVSGLAAAFLAAALLAGCDGGGGGGGGGWSGSGTVTYEVDGSSVDSSGGSTGAYFVPTDTTVLVNRASGGTGYPSVTIEFPGSGAGTFESSSSGGAVVTYVDEAGNVFRADDATGGTSYTLEVTDYGAVDEPIEGTFSATVGELGGTGTCSISNGTFTITRQPDGGGLTPARNLTGTWRSSLPGRGLEWSEDSGLSVDTYRADVELKLTQNGSVLTGTTRVFNIELVSGWLPLPDDPAPMAVTGGSISGTTCTFTGSGFVWEGDFTTDIMYGTVTESGLGLIDKAGEFNLFRQW